MQLSKKKGDILTLKVKKKTPVVLFTSAAKLRAPVIWHAPYVVLSCARPKITVPVYLCSKKG